MAMSVKSRAADAEFCECCFGLIVPWPWDVYLLIELGVGLRARDRSRGAPTFRSGLRLGGDGEERVATCGGLTRREEELG